MLNLTLLLGCVLLGDPQHYVIFFSQQNVPHDQTQDPHFSHSFATWVCAQDDQQIGEVFTISWTGEVGIKFFAGPQRGINRTLENSLDRSTNRCLCLTMWGPYRVCPGTYQRARCLYHQLERAECTEEIRYTVLDGFSRHWHRPTYNCMHALLNVTGETIRTWDRNGYSATEFIVEKYRERGLIQCHRSEDDWVWDAIRPPGHQIHRVYCP